MLVAVIAVLLLTVVSLICATELSQCIAPLGMESRLIPDEDIKASSSFNNAELGPQNGRLNLDIRSGAWCPNPSASAESTEWIEIELHSVHVITAVGTQGRFGNSQGQEYAENYMLDYWRPKLAKWARYRTVDNKEILPGNTNTYIEVKNVLNPPIWASKVRIIPYTAHRRTVCMRVEIYGCYWNAGIVSYTITNGDKKGNNPEFTDKTYDGQWGKDLHSGLGQLVDGVYGSDELWEDRTTSAWVGWRNDTARQPPSVVFEFDKIREFNAVHIFCNNKFTRDVKVFSEAIVTFSTSGYNYQEDAIQEFHIDDNIFESARNVSINLHHRIGKWVRIEFRFAAKWILISEIVFESDVTTDNYTSGGVRLGEKGSKKSNIVKDLAVNTSNPDDPIYVMITVGVVTALLILIAVAVIFFVHLYRRKKSLIHMFNRKATSNNQNEHEYCEEDITTHKSILLPIKPPTECGFGIKSDEYQECYQAVKCPEYFDYRTPVREMSDIEKGEPSLSDSSNNDYAVPDVSTLPLLSNHLPQPGNLIENTSNQHLLANDSNYRFLRSQNKYRENAGVLTSLLSQNNQDIADMVLEKNFDSTNVIDFPRHRLRMISKLAEGAFGTVYVAEAEGVPDYSGTISPENKLVAVKFLCHDATAKERDEFERDVCILASLSSPYLARVLGVCRTPPLAVVLEYLEFGDLCAFLREFSPPNTAILRHIASQIAGGMRYLESLNFVHRDLAARNCIVGKSYQIKISDFGADNEMYACDYYKMGNRIPIPIRWAAWESVLSQRYTTKSDVWAFAVTLHEIYTLCRRKPYEHLSNEEVLENLAQMQNNEDLFEHIAQSPQCPRDIYELMCRCWRRDELKRPTFAQLHLYLQHKGHNFAGT